MSLKQHALARPLARLQLGKRYPGAIPPLGIRFEFDGDSGPSIHLGYEGPTPLETYAARKGKVILGLMPFKKHTLFLLVQQQVLMDGWSDAPFCLGKVLAADRKSPTLFAAPEHADKGYGFFITMTDERGIVHAIRFVSVSPKFKAELDAALLTQQLNLSDFSEAAAWMEIEEASFRWTPEEMAQKAVIIETAGVPFNETA